MKRRMVKMNSVEPNDSEILLDSRIISETVGIRHNKIIRKIQLCCKILEETESELSQFFRGSTYKNSRNEILLCYKVTRYGYVMLAEKFTGTKKLQLKAIYIKHYFNRAEKKALTSPSQQMKENEWLKSKTIKNKTKIDCHDKALNVITVTAIANEYDMTAQAFNKLLCGLDIQYKKDGNWVLHKTYADMGYTQISTWRDKEGNIKSHIRWTQEGKEFLYRKLKEYGILPKIE